METVERLTEQEALAAKKMWSEIFYEDSEQFTDYYFAEKMADNTGYGLKEDGVLCSMLFLTHYRGAVCAPDRKGARFQEIPLSYIVGVGTRQAYRRRGYMGRLLVTALADLHRAGQPFAFLMPADPAIYTPYQFRYIYDRPVYTVLKKASGADNAHKVKESVMEEGEAEALAAFANRELERRFQLFLRRDGAYYRRAQKESRAMNGEVYLWKKEGEIVGFYLYARENQTEEIQEAMVREDMALPGLLHISEKTRPIIMGRITNVVSMLSLLRLESGASVEQITICFRLRDDLIKEHNATFLWTVGKKESTIAVSEEEEMAEACTEIGALTAFVFGRADCRACFLAGGGQKAALSGGGKEPVWGECAAEKEDAVFEKLARIKSLTRLCINEIV